MSAGQPKSRNVKLEDQQYDTIGQQIILEGAQKPWMACAFYTTVWQAAPLGAQEPAFKYSVSKLLNICNLSVLEFFEKLNKWAEMILAKGRLLEHINRVQANLAVSTVVYKKFLPIFRRVFVNHSDKTSAKSRANQIQGAINTAHVFEFSWLMFIALKKQFAGSVDDLMNSFHLLLCVVELVFVALKDLKLNSLINADFANTLTTKDETALESLCEMFEGVVLDAKHFQVHWLAPKLRKLTEDSVIVGSTKMGGLLTDINTNKKAFDSLYEEKMLKKSEVDERIFLSAATTNMDTVFNEALDATTITMLRRSNPNDASWAIDAELLLRMSTQNCLEKLNSQRNVQSQPSSKSYVITPEQFCPTTPITVSAHRSQKMAELLVEDFKNNENFDRLLAQCRDNPKTFIAERVALLEERLFLRVEQEKTAKGGGYDSNFSTTIKQRKENVEALFYRLLYQVISYDRERGANGGVESTEDLSTILYKVDFIGSLWICALELVVFTYASEREFPWSAEVAQVAPVNFYKIIELIVRAEPDLSREMVKHLNKVEERVLEELAWSMDSPLRALSLSSYDSYGAVKRHRLDYDDEYDTMEEDQREELLDNAGIPPRSKRPATDDYNVDTQQQQEFTQGVQALPSSITVFSERSTT
uniref:Retinoblastoma-associated protein n=1 Tax=Ditylenchus dipsaci TaxID=166011 RepID=A0A915D7Q7_9BILA